MMELWLKTLDHENQGMSTILRPGHTYPLGATICQQGREQGVNFSVYSKNSTGLELLLYEGVDDARPARVMRLARELHRTFHYWHVFVPGLEAGQVYAYRMNGPMMPEEGHRFDPEKILLDPYGRSVAVPEQYQRSAATGPGDNGPYGMKSVVTDMSLYDWQDDRPPQHPFASTIIYELHVGGFTKHSNAKVAPELRGTYAGMIEKIPYLQELGITAVELLPIYQFDPQEAPAGLRNYWGYNPVSFFSPHTDYGSSKDSPLAVLDEFRDLVKALHRARIEVILDVVYNHTAEGNERGPTFCFKGLENQAYYILSKERAHYENYSGTGNTLNANQSIVRRLTLDSLRYWVTEMHVDGFRFDLASILSRDEQGRPMANPPILWDIETDPVLSGTKLIAEAWDAAGLYQVGTFIGDRWKEWNGRFRDDVRSFVKGDRKMTGKLASRILGSPDLYAHSEREPEQSINFITCHDGFTLNDLVSYSQKHNRANGEENRDGDSHNRSWNHGVEGPTDDDQIERLRNRQIKNFFAINLIAIGTPMLSMGDEVRRTQRGNNNVYCQDNELSWFDWSCIEKQAGLLRFVKKLIHFRLSLPGFAQQHEMSLSELLRQADIRWHGVQLNQPDWSDDSHVVSVTIQGMDHWLHLLFNAYWEPLTFELPTPPLGGERDWRRIVDTSRESPEDFCAPKDAPQVSELSYRAAPRSVVFLLAEVARV
jgi:isoamylase